MNEFQRPFQLAPGASEILLVRHGAVTFDGSGLAGGGEDPPLTPVGRAQARALTRRLLHEPPDVLVVSPLRRALETAAPLAEATGLTPVTIPELREVGLGEWEGALSKRIAEGGPIIAELFSRQRWDVIPGAEPAPRFEARVRKALARIIDLAAPGGHAIAVVHGGVIAEALRQATRSAGFAFLRSENGSISRLVHAPDGTWTLRSFNDTAHLAELAQSAAAGQ